MLSGVATAIRRIWKGASMTEGFPASTAVRRALCVALFAGCATLAWARQPGGPLVEAGSSSSADPEGGAANEPPEVARTFAEPLAALGSPPTGETRSLAEAVAAYRGAGDIEAVEPLLAFLRNHPDSPWKPSLLGNLAVLYRHTGYLERSLEAAGEAWRLTRRSTDPAAKAIADGALATYTELIAALGRTDELSALLDEVRDRPLTGHAAEVRSSARTGLWSMRHDPAGSFRCGPLAVERVAEALRPGARADARLLRYPSTRTGTSLAEIGRLAGEAGLGLRAIRREPGSKIPVPAVVHWKAEHFAALVAQQGGRFLAKDLTFGEDRWLSRRAVEEEASGYMLVATAALREKGWRRIGGAEAATVRGRGASGNQNPGATTPTDPKKPALPGDCGGGSGTGMPVYDFHVAIVSLNVSDTPVGYTPPRGPAMAFGITYNSREDFQPATFTFTNLGSRWSFNWLSYIEDDDPNNAGQTIRLAERGGGSFVLPHVAGAPGGTYGPNVTGYHETVTRTLQDGVTVGFVRQYPDGSQDVYSHSDGATTMRRYFLTSATDPAGNSVTLTYDAATSRLFTLTDVLGQQTTLSYGLAGDIYKVTAVTDPFGRQALFAYLAGELASVTDAAGMTSSFTYGPAAYDANLAPDFMSSMTTPYGTTSFDMGEQPPAVYTDLGNVRWLLATDPLGNRERIEFLHEATNISETTTDPVPAGFQNVHLSYRNTFYWNQTAMQQYSDTDPNRYLNATYLFHWLRDATGSVVAASSIPESVQALGQRRVWFGYPGQTDTTYQGSLSLPAVSAQVLDTAQEQRLTRTYDASGHLQSLIDPAGRTYSFHYAANGIDLTAVRTDLVNGGRGEQLAAFTYNAQHLPLTFVDYAGQTSTATYNGFGQLTSLTRPDGVATILTYDARGFLTQVARAGTAYQESFTYDAANRLRTWTATDGTVLTFDYDSLDRLTRITYPDGTSDQAVFDRMDVVELHDRLGRVSRFAYDPADRLVAATDPANRTTAFSWCGCGAMTGMTDPLGHQTTWLRDGLDRMVGKLLNGRVSALYDYDGAGRLVRRTDALNQVTTYAYNVDGTLAAVSYQNAVHATPGVQYLWDPFYPRLALMSDQFGTTSYSYNPAGSPGAGQLAAISAPAPSHTVAFQYDLVGRRTGRAVDGVWVTTTHDAEDRLASLVSPLGLFVAAYDGASDRMTALLYPNAQGPTLAYLDAAHDFRLASLRWGPAGSSFNLSRFDYSYDAAHDQILGITWHDIANQGGRFFSFAYDPARRLTGRQQTTDPSQPPASVLHAIAYGYDGAGNRTSETIDGVVSLATFDSSDQLVALERGLVLQAQAAMRAARTRSGAARPAPSAPAAAGNGKGDRR